MESPKLLAFEYDDVAKTVKATRYDCTVDENGVITKGDRAASASVSESVVRDCLKRLMDQLIIIGDIEDGHEFYKSKGGTPIRVTKDSGGRLAIAGGWQMEHNNMVLPVNPDEIYTKQNGKSYQLNEQMPLATQKSIYMTLQERDEFSEFLKLLDGSGLTEVVRNKRYVCGGTNLTVFNTFHYTVYVPTNKSITDLQDAGKLPTWDDVANWEMKGNLTKKTEDSLKIENFLRYHIQDNALYIGSDNTSDSDDTGASDAITTEYETASINKKSKTFNKLRVTTDKSGTGLTIQDKAGQTRRVMTEKPGLFNLMAREYTYQNSDKSKATIIHNSSSAVVHLIDGPLMIEN
jgi:hypothetical protein